MLQFFFFEIRYWLRSYMLWVFTGIVTLLILPAVYHVVEKRVAATASGVSGQKFFARTRSGLRVSQRAENSIEAAGVRRTHVRISYCKIAQVGLYVES